MTQGRLPRFVRRPLAGWGHHPVENCDVYRPERTAELRALVTDAPQASLIPRGRGRSYGDAALNDRGAVLLSERLDHFLSLDEESGVLGCEAGVTLAEILEQLLPRGYFLPVTPGTKQISIGGAIAADVHGKNHHASGSMSAWVDRFHLLTGRNQILECSRERNPEVFWATIGGMGLTGVILDAEIRLTRVETAYVTAETQRIPDIDGLLERMAESDRDDAYSVAWLDSFATGPSLGRSILLRARHASPAALPAALRDAPLAEPPNRRPGIPFRLPDRTLNRATMRLFNKAFHAAHPTRTRLVGCDRFFYPLDAVADWNRAYGRRGVLQYQCVIPEHHARTGIRELLEALAERGIASFLTVLKTLGPASEGMLGFAMPGKTLALDVPHTGPAALRALHALDQIVLAHEGRVYLAKDACLTRATFERMYPRLAEWKRIRSELDPDARFESSLARRLGLSEPGP